MMPILKKKLQSCHFPVMGFWLLWDFYSILYYNTTIWLTPEISTVTKQNLLSISANALRSCLMHDGFDLYRVNLADIITSVYYCGYNL